MSDQMTPKDKTPTESVQVEETRVKDAVGAIMDFCQAKGFTELEGYMAMIHITNTMEETLGFGYRREVHS